MVKSMVNGIKVEVTSNFLVLLLSVNSKLNYNVK